MSFRLRNPNEGRTKSERRFAAVEAVGDSTSGVIDAWPESVDSKDISLPPLRRELLVARGCNSLLVEI